MAARRAKIALVRRAVLLLVLAAGCGRFGFGTHDERDGGGDVGGDGSTCSVKLGAGRQHMTAINDGFVRVWGYGMYGQIGDGQMMDRATPTTIALPDRVVHASAGRYETCVALANGRVSCWGEGDSGQLGDGNNTTSPTPVIVAKLTNAVEVAAAAIHACARLATGEVWCWGNGGSGRLGTGTQMGSLVPVQTLTITNAQRLIAGGSTSCVMLADNTLRCWGFNQYGGVGNNTMQDVLSPIEPMNIGAVRSVSSRDTTTCAARADGAVFCWGLNDRGQAGIGTTGGNVLVPTPVKTATVDLTGADEVGQGIEHGCARIGTAVWCWGRNDSGQLGDGTTGVGRPYAASVIGLPPVTQLGIGAWTSCAVDMNQAVWCWGMGSEGELGNGTTPVAQPTPLQSFDACR